MDRELLKENRILVEAMKKIRAEARKSKPDLDKIFWIADDALAPPLGHETR